MIEEMCGSDKSHFGHSWWTADHSKLWCRGIPTAINSCRVPTCRSVGRYIITPWQPKNEDLTGGGFVCGNHIVSGLRESKPGTIFYIFEDVSE